MELTQTENPLVQDFVNPVPQVIIAANGDELWITLSGQVTLEPQGGTLFTAVWSGEGVVEGGTGRFANAMPGAQPLKVTAVNAPFDIAKDAEWSFSWTLEGPIVLR